MVTPGFHAAPTVDAAALKAAWRYAAVQPFIVDKRPMFEAMVRLVDAAGPAPQRVIEWGVGTGGFLEALARSAHWPEAELAGCDLSPARIAVASQTMARLARSATLHANVNALNPADPFYSQVAPPSSADIIALSQFEHYAPNSEASPLADRLRQADQPWCTKSALRRLARSRLRPGGWLFVIDDYAADTEEEQNGWDHAWDVHVVKNFSRSSVREVMAAVDPAWADALARRYDPARPLARRLALAARARTRRRHRDGEEIQSLTAAREDFQAVFGEKNCGILPHPSASTHPQFFLLWGRVATE